MDVAVLGIKNLPATAGADRVVEKLLENFSPENQYWVYLRKDGSAPTPPRENLHYITIGGLKGKHLGSFSFFFLSCLHVLFRGHYDLIHVHNSDFGLFVPLLRLKVGVPVLGTFHGDPYTRAKWGRVARAYLRLSERFFVQFCHRLTSVSRYKSEGRGLWSRKPIEYIPNGVDSYWEESAPESFDFDAYGLGRGEYVLFACGRLDATKGLHHLLEAWQSTSRASKLLVVGDFGHDAAYTAKVEAMMAGDDSIVAHRELLPREALLEVVRNCQLFVFPSEYEAMSMMLLEAISCRRPVLCSDIPENLEVLLPGYPHVHHNKDAGSLRERLDAALGDQELEGWTDRLYQRCMREYSWPAIAASYERIYQELTGGTVTQASRSVEAGSRGV